MKRLLMFAVLLLVALPLASLGQSKDFERGIKGRYEGKLVQVQIQGLYVSVRPAVQNDLVRDHFIVYAHYPEAVPTEKNKVFSLNSQGDSPITQIPFRGGANPADLRFVVSGANDNKTLVQADFVGWQTFLVQPSSTLRIKEVRVNKRKIRFSMEAISAAYGPAKPGVDFDFYFDEDKVIKAGNVDVITAEIDQFFVLRN